VVLFDQNILLTIFHGANIYSKLRSMDGYVIDCDIAYGTTMTERSQRVKYSSASSEGTAKAGGWGRKEKEKPNPIRCKPR
jgi:hypothetical protein